MNKPKLAKIATLKVKDGEYEDQNGNRKTRWREVGVLISTPHASSMFIKLHATAFSEARSLNIFYDDGVKLSLDKTEDELNSYAASRPMKQVEALNEVIDSKTKTMEISDDEIPL